MESVLDNQKDAMNPYETVDRTGVALRTIDVGKIFGVSPDAIWSWIRKDRSLAPKKGSTGDYEWTNEDVYNLALHRYSALSGAPPLSTNQYRHRVGDDILIMTSQNQKGGVGKTTLVFNLLGPASEYGYRTLVLDWDNQRNLTKRIIGKTTPYKADLDYHFLELIRSEEEDLRRENVKAPTILDFFTGGAPLAKLIRRSRFPLVDFIPGSAHVYLADKELAKEENNWLQSRFKQELRALSTEYDLILCDMPANVVASEGLWTVMVAATGAVIPIVPSDLAWDAVRDLRQQIDQLVRTSNPRFQIYGFLLSQYQGNTTYSHDFWEGFRRETNCDAFMTVLNHAVLFVEAMHHAQPLSLYKRFSEYAYAYREIFRELIQRHVTLFRRAQ